MLLYLLFSLYCVDGSGLSPKQFLFRGEVFNDTESITTQNFIYNFNTEGVSVKLIEGEPMYVDMLILSKCSVLLIAPSTLSAWSAYLNNNKNVYVPKIWVSHHWTNDIPQEWKLF